MSEVVKESRQPVLVGFVLPVAGHGIGYGELLGRLFDAAGIAHGVKDDRSL